MLMFVVETGQALLMAFLSLNYFTKFEKFLSKNETRLPLWFMPEDIGRKSAHLAEFWIYTMHIF